MAERPARDDYLCRMTNMPPNPEHTPPPPVGDPIPQPSPGPSAPPPGPIQYGAPQQYAGAVTKDETTMATLLHVLVIFTGFVGPLIIWLIKKDESPFIDRHGKAALNFSITLTIAYFVSAILILVLIGLLLILVLLVVGIVLPIIAAMAANKGQEYDYPLTIKFIK